MRYRIYLGDFEKKIFESDEKIETERVYLSAILELMNKQKYPIFIWDSKEKKSILKA